MKKNLIIVFVFSIFIYPLNGYSQIVSKKDTSDLIRRAPKSNKIDITLPKGNMNQKKHNKAIDAKLLLNDALPNPNSPEGKKRQKEITKNKIVEVNTAIQLGVEKTCSEMLNAVKSEDEEKFSSIYKTSKLFKSQLKNESDFNVIRKKQFQDFVKCFNDYNISIKDFSFGVTKINSKRNILKVIMINKEGIETSSYILELEDGEWIITKINL